MARMFAHLWHSGRYNIDGTPWACLCRSALEGLDWLEFAMCKLMTGIYSTGVRYTQIKTLFYDQLVCDTTAEQIVVLNAGYDTKFYRFADKLRGKICIEVDDPARQAQKRRILDNGRVDRSHVTYVSSADLFSGVIDPTKSVLFVAECLFYVEGWHNPCDVARFISANFHDAELCYDAFYLSYGIRYWRMRSYGIIRSLILFIIRKCCSDNPDSFFGLSRGTETAIPHVCGLTRIKNVITVTVFDLFNRKFFASAEYRRPVVDRTTVGLVVDESETYWPRRNRQPCFGIIHCATEVVVNAEATSIAEVV